MSKSDTAVVMNRLMNPELPVNSGVVLIRLPPVKPFVDPDFSESLYNGQLRTLFVNQSIYPLLILFNSSAFPL